jgi:hypothetical protein
LGGEPGAGEAFVAEGTDVGDLLEQCFHGAHNSISKISRDEHGGWSELRFVAQMANERDDLTD